MTYPPPDPIYLLKAGLTLPEAAILWHLALCGLTGSRAHQTAEAAGLQYKTTSAILRRLAKRKLIETPASLQSQGCPNLYVISRLGFRLMTHNAARPRLAETYHPPLAITA
jgi:hypothetical protein